MPRPILLFAAALTLACGGGSEPEAASDPVADSLHGLALPEPIPRPATAGLVDTEGQPYDVAAETEGRLTFLFFGYTHCPDVCPIHMGNLAAALEHLGSRAQRETSVVFVTTDPERDTPERIRAWLDRWDRSFIGLRGTDARVAEIQAGLRMPRSVQEAPDADGDYLVGHAAQMVAFAPDGRTVFYPFGTRTAELVHDIPLLLGDAPARRIAAAR